MYNLAIAACFRDELQYMKEWIEYHLLIGVEHFYLANNDIYNDLANELLKPYIEKGLVTSIKYDNQKLVQLKAIPELIQLADTKWLAIIDFDEFIFPERVTFNIYNDIIKQFEQKPWAAIGLNWCVFGNNNIIFPPKLLTQAFFRRANKEDNCNRTIKFIVRPKYIKECLGHSFTFKRDTFAVNTIKRPIYPNINNKYKAKNPHWLNLRLNHYMIRSLFDFVNKVGRGFNGKTRMFNNEEVWSKYFAEFNRNEVKDFGMKFCEDKLREKLCITSV